MILLIDDGVYANVHELANALGKDFGYIARTIRPALLCPDIVHAALNGTLPDGVSLKMLRYATVDEDRTKADDRSVMILAPKTVSHCLRYFRFKR